MLQVLSKVIHQECSPRGVLNPRPPLPTCQPLFPEGRGLAAVPRSCRPPPSQEQFSREHLLCAWPGPPAPAPPPHKAPPHTHTHNSEVPKENASPKFFQWLLPRGSKQMEVINLLPDIL